MSGLFVVVDDQDSDIHFSTGWGPTAAENAFQFAGTMTAPGGQGSTATYSFEGTSISVFGLMRANSGGANTTFTFTIDGDAQSSQNATIGTDGVEHFHRKFFQSQTLADGPHTLDILVAATQSTDVLLDYLIYEASQNAALDTSTTARLLVLNTSPQLAYSSGWSPTISGLRSGLVETAISLNSSVAGAVDLGATVALNFTGVGIEVRGVLVTPFPSPVAAYSIDGGPLTDVQMPASDASYENAQSNFPFIAQTFGTVGTHSLVITPLIPGAFYFDFITVQSSTASFPPKANIALPPSLTSSTALTPTTTTGSPTGTTSPSSGNIPPGAIAGICIGIAGEETMWEADTVSRGTSVWPTHSDTASSRSITPYIVGSRPRNTSLGARELLASKSTQPNPVMALKASMSRAGPVSRADEASGTMMTAPPAYTDRAPEIV
ncbi:hypothetical protein MSAN_02038600 [Mycena sanguinolenta]|uniref:Uncharacterized protein n=1 Tax=Mycena sanguinolenta TaxID=230812 RepID=A0A8H7CNK2_9AGAR|nr:hypothetical protein MSAN_02038600 [Mycena sanguinolenta]